MSALDFEAFVRQHPLFADLTEEQLRQVLHGAREEYFAKDRFIFRQGGEAATLYLLRDGTVGLEASLPDGRREVLQTLESGDTLGWSWLMPPHVWNFDARAHRTTLAVALDGAVLLKLIQEDDHAGKLLLHRFLRIVVQRLEAARGRLLEREKGIRAAVWPAGCSTMESGGTESRRDPSVSARARCSLR